MYLKKVREHHLPIGFQGIKKICKTNIKSLCKVENEGKGAELLCLTKETMRCRYIVIKTLIKHWEKALPNVVAAPFYQKNKFCGPSSLLIH